MDAEETGEVSYTNDPRLYKRARRYYKEAKADGWKSNPAYPDFPEEDSAILTKRGFSLFIMMRTKDSGCTGYWEYDVTIDGLGPDRLPIILPKRYDWKGIKRAWRTCHECGATKVNTIQWNWRKRVCVPCHAKLKAEEQERLKRRRELVRTPQKKSSGTFGL